MRNYKILLFLFLFAILPNLVFSQDKKPKVALVLSGGGAKGLAHIPLLQTLDSLGIVPDLIIGTSMGSIVGGLYAMGYSGDSIAHLSSDIDWDNLLGGDVSLSKVGVEEKKEFKRYLINIDIFEGKPTVNASFLKDQNLREFLTSITYPVYDINDFDNLPIPFRAMATDLVNGKEVIVDNGPLSVAMRASMSIPIAFKPVPYRNILLVDGGVLNNFPTDVAKNMGADIIIGSDVGGGMEPIEELDNISSIIFQTAMLNSNLKNPENRKLCNILVDHVPNLTYSTGDFSKSKEMYEEGKIATIEQKQKLETLAKQLRTFEQRTHKLPKTVPRLTLDSITYSNISEANLNLVKSRINIQTQKPYSPDELIEGIDRAIGTQLFNEIQYHPFKEDGDKFGVEIEGFEKSRHQAKIGLHYDNAQGFGIILNYTGRNVIGNASRLVTTLDLAEQPKLRIQYQKNFGKHKNWWYSSQIFGEKLEQHHYISGKNGGGLKHRYLNYDFQFNKNLNPLRSFIGFGFDYDYSGLKPSVDPTISNNIHDLVSFRSDNIQMKVLFDYNTMNLPFFATSGTSIYSEFSRSLMHKVDISFYENPGLNVKGTTNNFNKFELNFKKRSSFSKKITGVFGLDTGFIIVDDLKSDELSFLETGHTSKFILGGNIERPRKNSYVFKGLNEGELSASQYMKLDFELQYNLLKNIYLIPHFSIASVGFYDFNSYIETAFTPKGNWQEGIETSILTSTGVTAAYKSILGPIEFDFSYVNHIEKMRFFFKMGIEIGRAN